MFRFQRLPLLPLLAGAVTVVLVATGCPPGGTVVAGRPECPTDSVMVPRDTGVVIRRELAAPGPITLVPEFHDCQRLLSPSEPGFGPLVAVFATYKLDSLLELYSTRTITTVTPGGTERAAATILNYHQPYAPLRIEHGINCLYLTALGQSWSAHIVHVATDSACVRSLGSNPGGADLSVRVAPGPGGDSVPPVARWDWDSVAHKQYIGLRCGKQWCEVFDPSQAALNSSPRYEGSVQLAVKGWYDEQYLAVPSSKSPIGLEPGLARGTIVPVEDLGSLVNGDFEGKWRKVATVSLSVESPKYKQKFNLVQSTPRNGASVVLLCKGDQGACGVPSGAIQETCDNGAEPWWAQIVATNGSPRFRCVKERTHANIVIPGIVRWRWQNDDDDMWIRCPTGCCHVN